MYEQILQKRENKWILIKLSRCSLPFFLSLDRDLDDPDEDPEEDDPDDPEDEDREDPKIHKIKLR